MSWSECSTGRLVSFLIMNQHQKVCGLLWLFQINRGYTLLCPYSVSEPSSGKGSSLSAAMSVSRLASSLATNAERLWGQILPSESSIVQTFQHATLKLLVVFINFFHIIISLFSRWCEIPICHG